MARSKREDLDGLVLMTKDGESIAVHPSCVKAHEIAGWALIGEE